MLACLAEKILFNLFINNRLTKRIIDVLNENSKYPDVYVFLIIVPNRSSEIELPVNTVFIRKNETRIAIKVR